MSRGIHLGCHPVAFRDPASGPACPCYRALDAAGRVERFDQRHRRN
ncbi:hypothetical protein [Nonomuraea recticatena]